MSKKNCWDHKKCGRQPGGSHVKDLGLCPATQEVKLDGEHGGRNAGRACWIVAKTLCNGSTQGGFAQKYKDCSKCDFYEKVRDEEYPSFKLSAVLLAKIKQ